MSNGWKALLGLGALAVALKIWSDSQAMTDKLKKNTQTPTGTVSVGGTPLPTPTPKSVSVDILEPIILASGSNAEANPATDYNQGYWGVEGEKSFSGQKF